MIIRGDRSGSDPLNPWFTLGERIEARLLKVLRSDYVRCRDERAVCLFFTTLRSSSLIRVW